ncbi:MAG: heavy metal translocating P-type ATPase, partial [Proteocatella sp.]
ESTVSKILELVQNASNKKSKSEKFITKFARYYTPAVVIIAVFMAFGVPLVTGAEFKEWLSRSLIFLVISCPCALVISVPLSFFGGIGGASRRGVLVKGGNYLEMLADTEVVVFDKTGTLTKGVFEVNDIKVAEASGIKEEDLLELAAYAESYSNHPIAKSIIKSYGKAIDNSRVSFVEELSGHGVKVIIDGNELYAGNKKLMDMIGISSHEVDFTAVHIAFSGKYLGSIELFDKLKTDAKNIVNSLKNIGVSNTVMLTGDSHLVANKVAKELNIDKVYSELLPGDKVEKIEQIFKDMSLKGRLAFIGDGINDAPVLARADIGIAMGGLGSDAAIEAADIVIMTDEPSKIIDAIKVSKKTIKIAKQNIVFALGVKLIVLVLGALGMASMWAAVFADVGVSFLAVVNSMRAMKFD